MNKNKFTDRLSFETYMKGSKGKAKINALKAENTVSIELGGDYLAQIFLLAQIIEGMSKKMSKDFKEETSLFDGDTLKKMVDLGKKMGFTDEMINVSIMTECVMSLIHEMHEMNLVQMSLGGIKTHVANSKEELDVMEKILHMDKNDVDNIINKMKDEK